MEVPFLNTKGNEAEIKNGPKIEVRNERELKTGTSDHWNNGKVAVCYDSLNSKFTITLIQRSFDEVMLLVCFVLAHVKYETYQKSTKQSNNCKTHEKHSCTVSSDSALTWKRDES